MVASTDKGNYLEDHRWTKVDPRAPDESTFWVDPVTNKQTTFDAAYAVQRRREYMKGKKESEWL